MRVFSEFWKLSVREKEKYEQLQYLQQQLQQLQF